MKTITFLKKHTTLVIVSLLTILIVLALFGVFSSNDVGQPKLSTLDIVPVEGNYSAYILEHETLHLDTNQEHTISLTNLVLADGEALNQNQYYEWISDTSIRFSVDVEQEGLYLIQMEYQSTTSSHMPITLSVKLNNEEDYPFYEASQIILNSLWKEESFDVLKDRYGNDVSIRQALAEEFINVPLRDAERIYPDGLYFKLDEGINEIEITKNEGELILKSISIVSRPQYLSYEDYLSNHENSLLTSSYKIRYEAEEAYYKNSSSIVRGINRDPLILPFSMSKLKLNVLGTDSYHKPGDAVTYKVDVEEAGLYELTFRVKQTENHRTHYRTLYVNGEIPFEEARHLVFGYNSKWQDVTLQSFDQEPFLIYLEPGDEITLEVDSTLFGPIYKKLQVMMKEISELGLDVTKLTRNNTDRGIDWNIIEYFPNIYDDLDRWINDIKEINNVLQDLYGYERQAQTIQDLKAAVAKLNQIRGNINELPRRLTTLSTGSSSALQLIANQLDAIVNQTMIIDAFYVHTSDQNISSPTPSFFKSFSVSISRFFLSFFDPSYSEKAGPNELEIWVNRSRQYVDIIQQVADQSFTPESGIKVKVSLINDDGKLLLANSADQQPDLAMGISAWIPNEYGMRGMLYDMRQQDDYLDTISVFNPEQLIPMIYDDKLFGLPETENFYVMYYRRDILVDQLGLEVPNTWEDVLNILPILRRYGMSFYIPLSSNNAFKSFDTTAPFIYQFGGHIYAEDGFSGGIDDENSIRALTFMTDLYREYSTPYQVPSFFNSFRYGEVPIGIGDFGMYLQLTNAAADIRGLWDIALVPGMPQQVINEVTLEEETVINRSMPGAQQASIIFEKSDKKDEAWQFLSWWMSTDTQIYFSETLINTLGTRYIWNTANLEAFESLRLDESHKEVILEQWTHLKEVQKIPGSYIIEREISNTWNSVVYNDANLRSTVSDAMIKINKEIERKMREFGYLDSRGTVIKPFNLPTRDTVLGWYEND
ncbi:MAG: extracellular solute-binding protein [Acholeplasmataceae bacterium]|jgi:ABC-type glycerol-3-phosphate transport system substrate-binding protein|nr:extracellular solute-binding protein [Acholeplasmataceae bacterium]